MGRKRKEQNTGEEGARNTIVIGLSPDTNRAVNQWLLRNGGWGKAAFVRMLIEWFTAAPDSLQHVIAGTVPADMREEFKRRASDWIAKRIDAMQSRPPVAEGADLDPDVVARIKLHASNDGISPSQLVKEWLDGRSGDPLRSQSADSAERESARTSGHETSGPPTAKPKSEPPEPIARR